MVFQPGEFETSGRSSVSPARSGVTAGRTGSASLPSRVALRGSLFLPVRVLSRVFRGKPAPTPQCANPPTRAPRPQASPSDFRTARRATEDRCTRTSSLRYNRHNETSNGEPQSVVTDPRRGDRPNIVEPPAGQGGMRALGRFRPRRDGNSIASNPDSPAASFNPDLSEILPAPLRVCGRSRREDSR